MKASEERAFNDSDVYWDVVCSIEYTWCAMKRLCNTMCVIDDYLMFAWRWLCFQFRQRDGTETEDAAQRRASKNATVVGLILTLLILTAASKKQQVNQNSNTPTVYHPSGDIVNPQTGETNAQTFCRNRWESRRENYADCLRKNFSGYGR